MAQLNFGGTIENVVIRDEFPLEKAREAASLTAQYLSTIVTI